MAEIDVEKEKQKWEAGYRLPAGLGEVYVAREIEKLGKLSRSDQKRKRFSFLKRKQDAGPDYRELREEFRAFLHSSKETVDLYLWFALSNLADRSVNRKLESKVYHLFGDVANTFLYIEQNFDPTNVTQDLLAFLKDRITRIASPGAFDITSNASTITQSGEGERLFLETVSSLLDTALGTKKSRIPPEYGKTGHTTTVADLDPEAKFRSPRAQESLEELDSIRCESLMKGERKRGEEFSRSLG